MKPGIRTMITGAGGIGSYLLPVLVRTFDTSGYLCDGDTIEDRNLERQMFRPSSVGKNKARELNRICGSKQIRPMDVYLDNDWIYRNREWAEAESFDVLICCVDNDPARRAVIRISNELGVPVVVAANERFTAQAYYWHPEMPESFHPFSRFPEMMDNGDGDRTGCSDPEMAEAYPQLAVANMSAASLALQLLWRWHAVPDLEIRPGLPVEHQTTFGRTESLVYGDITPAANQ